MKKNSNKVILAVVVLLVLAVIMATVYMTTRPEANSTTGDKSVCVQVIHKDGAEKVYICHYTDAQYLSEVLLADGIIQGKEGPYGLEVQVVDGEQAIWEEDGAYWALYVGEEYATTGVSQTPLEDGAVYKLVYTVG